MSKATIKVSVEGTGFKYSIKETEQGISMSTCVRLHSKGKS